MKLDLEDKQIIYGLMLFTVFTTWLFIFTWPEGQQTQIDKINFQYIPRVYSTLDNEVLPLVTRLDDLEVRMDILADVERLRVKKEIKGF